MTTPTPAPQAATAAPVASTQPASPVEQQVSEFPTGSNWRTDFLSAEPTQTPQPVVSEEPVAPETAEVPAEVAAAPAVAPVEEVNTESLGETDVALYQRLMDDLAAQHPGVDEKFLKRTADAQFQYLKAKEKIGDQAKDITKLLKDVKKVYKPPTLTALEQSIVAPPAPAAEAPPAPVAASVATSTPPPAGDPVIAMANSWQSEYDVVNAEQVAWGAFHEATTPAEQAAASRQIWVINQAKTRMQMAQYADFFEKQAREQAEEIINQRLGDVLPAMRQTAQQAAIQQDHEFAIQQLEAAEPNLAIRDLFKAEDGALEYNGESFENTQYNRIVAENPEILDIAVSHKDPRMANRLTQIKRMKIALRLAGVQQAPPAATSAAAPDPAVQALMEASAQVQPVPGQSTRQSINAGPGASGTAPTPGNSFFESGASAEIRHRDWYSK